MNGHNKEQAVNEFPFPDIPDTGQTNAPGKYYVGESCIGCAICTAIAPENFRIDHHQGYDYVHKQPETPAEEALCIEAMDICPANAIGDDGDS